MVVINYFVWGGFPDRLISEKVVSDEIKRELFLDTQSTFEELYTDEAILWGWTRTNSAVQSNVVLFNGLTTLNNLPLHPIGLHARKYIQSNKLNRLPRHSWTRFEGLCVQDGVLQVEDSHLLAEAGHWLWCRGQCGLVSGGVERGTRGGELWSAAWAAWLPTADALTRC